MPLKDTHLRWSRFQHDFSCEGLERLTSLFWWQEQLGDGSCFRGRSRSLCPHDQILYFDAFVCLCPFHWSSLLPFNIVTMSWSGVHVTPHVLCSGGTWPSWPILCSWESGRLLRGSGQLRGGLGRDHTRPHDRTHGNRGARNSAPPWFRAFSLFVFIHRCLAELEVAILDSVS